MNRKAFYDALRSTFGALKQSQIDGLELILDEGLRRGLQLDFMAYVFATAWWETARTMQPVAEAFWVKNAEAWRKKNLRYYPFYGRGYVQLTWEDNYRKASNVFGVDFVKNPDLVMQPKYSAPILVVGMQEGWFTGKKMADYLDGVDEDDVEDLREFSSARRIVNGTDAQVEIGKLALTFEAALRAAGYGTLSGTRPDIVIVDEIAVEQPRKGFWAAVLAFLSRITKGS